MLCVAFRNWSLAPTLISIIDNIIITLCKFTALLDCQAEVCVCVLQTVSEW